MKVEHKVDENKNKKLPRKLRKIIVEKKRRERIDTALKQLKDMMFGGSELQNDYMRMEKADILENVVKYMQSQPGKVTSSTCQSKGSCDAQYRLGYLQCVREVNGVMDRICGPNSQITQSLTHYLNIKVTQLTNQYLAQDRITTHSHTLASPKADKYSHPLRIIPECTSTRSVPTHEQRVPPLHPSHHSAFHKVPGSNPSPSVTPTDNISIAVYQYNHYNNYRNELARAQAESNININPVIKVEAQSSQSQGQINTVKNESHDINKNLNVDDAFIKQDSDMWRPW